MPINDFKPFAIQGGANVVSQSTYASSVYLGSGFTSGVANAAQFNKTWRQSSVIATIIAQTIADVVAVDVLDNGNTTTLETNFLRLLRQPGLYVVDTGAANTMVATMSPAPTALSSLLGVPFIIKAAAANTGATTLNLNAFGGINVKTSAIADLSTGVIQQGSMVILIYDGTQFQMISK